MPKKNSLELWKKMVLAGVGLCFLAFKAPEKNDLVELSGLLHGRSEAKFRSTDNNQTFDVKSGTRARVVETKFFEGTKNYGICLEILNASDLPANQKCTWVYYDSKNPNMQLFSVAKNETESAKKIAQWAQDPKKIQIGIKTKNPAQAQAAEVTRTSSGLIENKAPAGSATPDSMASARVAILNMDRMNRVGAQAVNPNNNCTTCAKEALKIESYGQCHAKNDYLENEIAKLLPGLSTSPTETIRKECIQRSMDLAPKSKSFYVACQNPNGTPTINVEKACTSPNYVDLTAKSFNLVADCLGDYTGGDKREMALAIYALTSFESGLQVNAMSSSKAGGIGQFVGGAIGTVNDQLKLVRQHLAQSKNPLCQKVLGAAVQQPMDTSASHRCERVSLNKDNPLKNMIYTFVFQSLQKDLIEKTVLKSRIFSGVLSAELPIAERDRLSSSLMIWSHNTGGKGMTVPLKTLFARYLQSGKVIKTKEDVDQVLVDLRHAMVSSSAPENSQRVGETSNFLKNIQSRLSLITQEPRSCLAK